MRSRSIPIVATALVLVGTSCIGQAGATRTPPPPSPTPASVPLWDACNHTYVSVSGQISIDFVQMRSTSYRFLMSTREGDQVYLLTVWLPVGTFPNSVEPLPSSFTGKDVRIHTNSGAVVGAYSRVTLTGKVFTPPSPSEGRLPCSLDAELVEAAP